MKKKIVILTGSELRHRFFRKKVALHNGIEVLKAYCETEQNLLAGSSVEDVKDLRLKHLKARAQSEKDFFELFVDHTEDHSNAEVIDRASINDEQYYKEIIALNPDLVIVYGASIIREPLLSAFKGRMLNVHLGLSPYYRGSATNFWPLAEELPECVGATFMYIDEGIDTGEIIHQIRPAVNYYDTPSTIGNRLIKEMTDTFCEIIIRFDHLQKAVLDQPGNVRRYCKKKDYNEEAVERVYANFNKGMIHTYLEDRTTRNRSFPLVENPQVSYDQSSNVSLC